MKALVYHGPMDVRIDDKPKPKIEHQEDIILKVTKTALCGSDLHLYHGTVEGMDPGQTLGHEFMGTVEEAGTEVHEVKQGDRVVLPPSSSPMTMSAPPIPGTAHPLTTNSIVSTEIAFFNFVIVRDIRNNGIFPYIPLFALWMKML